VNLAKGQPGRVFVGVGSEQRLRIFILAERPLTSYTLAKVADTGGSTIPAEAVWSCPGFVDT